MQQYKIEKEFKYKGYSCVVVAQSLGHRYGYIGLDKSNSLYGKDYDELYDIEVHGGLTFSDGGYNAFYPIESNLWWLGFDCAHWGDGKDINIIKELNDDKTIEYFLEMEREFPSHGIVKSLEYCIKECQNVVDQIIEINERGEI